MTTIKISGADFDDGDFDFSTPEINEVFDSMEVWGDMNGADRLDLEKARALIEYQNRIVEETIKYAWSCFNKGYDMKDTIKAYFDEFRKE